LVAARGVSVVAAIGEVEDAARVPVREDVRRALDPGDLDVEGKDGHGAAEGEPERGRARGATTAPDRLARERDPALEEDGEGDDGEVLAKDEAEAQGEAERRVRLERGRLALLHFCIGEGERGEERRRRRLAEESALGV